MKKLYDTEQSEADYNGRLNTRSNSTEPKNPQVAVNTANRALGRGTQSSVKDHPTDPHMVKKHNILAYDNDADWRGTKKRDGFHAFIEYLIEKDLLDNIHFPRVYNIKKIVDSLWNHMHTYTMERLIPLESVTRKEIDAFIEHNIVENLLLTSDFVDDSRYVEEMAGRAVAFIGRAVDNEGYIDKYIITDSLKEALFILKDVGSEIWQALDSHSGNYMWRRTSTGVTLVFSDPFF